jgi:hypothetical protein
MRKGMIDADMVIKMPVGSVNNIIKTLTSIAKKNYHIDKGPLFTIVPKRVNDYISENRLVPNQPVFGDIDESTLVRQAISPFQRLMDKVQIEEKGTMEEPYFEIEYDDNKIGFISTQNDGTYLTSELTSLDGSQQGKGIGTVAYLKLAKLAQEKGLQLRSDTFNRMSEAAIGLWERFVRTGQAEKLENGYIFVQNLQDESGKESYKTLQSSPKQTDLPTLKLKC